MLGCLPAAFLFSCYKPLKHAEILENKVPVFSSAPQTAVLFKELSAIHYSVSCLLWRLWMKGSVRGWELWRSPAVTILTWTAIWVPLDVATKVRGLVSVVTKWWLCCWCPISDEAVWNAAKSWATIATFIKKDTEGKLMIKYIKLRLMQGTVFGSERKNSLLTTDL